jgi:hypothetical protein
MSENNTQILAIPGQKLAAANELLLRAINKVRPYKIAGNDRLFGLGRELKVPVKEATAKASMSAANTLATRSFEKKTITEREVAELLTAKKVRTLTKDEEDDLKFLLRTLDRQSAEHKANEAVVRKAAMDLAEITAENKLISDMKAPYARSKGYNPFVIAAMAVNKAYNELCIAAKDINEFYGKEIPAVVQEAIDNRTIGVTTASVDETGPELDVSDISDMIEREAIKEAETAEAAKAALAELAKKSAPVTEPASPEQPVMSTEKSVEGKPSSTIVFGEQ